MAIIPAADVVFVEHAFPALGGVVPPVGSADVRGDEEQILNLRMGLDRGGGAAAADANGRPVVELGMDGET